MNEADNDIEMVKAFFGILILSIIFIATAWIVVFVTGNIFNAVAPLGAFVSLIWLAWVETKSR